MTIVILLISIATITFLGVISNHRTKGMSSPLIMQRKKNINRQEKSKNNLASIQKAKKISSMPKIIQEYPKKLISTENELEFYEDFKKETGKNAIWHGKITKGYLAWKEKRDKIKSSVSQHQISNDIDLQRQFEEETGKNAIWHGRITKGYLTWKDKYEKIK